MKHNTVTSLRLLCLLLFGGVHMLAYAQSANIDSLEQVLKTEISDTNKIEIWTKLCREYRGNNPVKSRTYGSRAIFTAKEIGRQDLLVKAQLMLIPLLRHTARDTADRMMDESLSIATAIKDSNSLMRVYNYKGIFAASDNEYEAAKAYYQKAIEIASATGEPHPGFYINLATLQIGQSNFQAAMDNYFNALGIYQESQNHYGLGIVYNNIGVAYYDQGDFEKALEYYQQSYEAYRKTNEKVNTLQVMTSIANTFEAMGQREKALENYEEVLSESEKLGDHNNILWSKASLALFFSEEEPIQSERAEIYLRELSPYTSSMEPIT
ncbi:MAG: tetratricopeptide repeat protein, partial [Bacteroidota bacterium]